MDNCIALAEIDLLDVADVLVDRGVRAGEFTPEGAAAEQVAVEPNHVVASRPEQRYQNAADVPVVAGDENLHGVTSRPSTADRQRPTDPPAASLTGRVSMHCQNDW